MKRKRNPIIRKERRNRREALINFLFPFLFFNNWILVFLFLQLPFGLEGPEARAVRKKEKPEVKNASLFLTASRPRLGGSLFCFSFLSAAGK